MIIDKNILYVLKKLKGLDFCVTGSIALAFHGKLNREIHDLDIISDDPRVLKILQRDFKDDSDSVYGAYQYRFLHQDTAIDLFPIKVPEHRKFTIEGLELNIVEPYLIFLDKINRVRDNNTPKIMVTKCLHDLEQYFYLTYNCN